MSKSEYFTTKEIVRKKSKNFIRMSTTQLRINNKHKDNHEKIIVIGQAMVQIARQNQNLKCKSKM